MLVPLVHDDPAVGVVDVRPRELPAMHAELELRQVRDAESSLQRFLAARSAAAAGAPAVVADATDDDDDDDDSSRTSDGGQTQAWLMLAQAADLRGDAAASSAWFSAG